MKMFSDCSGPCETCQTFYTGGCMAGHGDDDYVHATPEWIKEYEENGGKSLDSVKECGTFEIEEKSTELLILTFAEPIQFNEGDIMRVKYSFALDGSMKIDYTIERA